MVDFVMVAVVDPHGRVLLQERDEHAPVAPEQWSLPGGAVEPGEQPRDTAARELTEETELVVPAGDLDCLGDFHVVISVPLDFQVFAARADAGNEDVVCHEGRQMVFVDRRDLEELDLAASTRLVLPALDAWIEQTRVPPRLAAVILVDRRGRILLQQRDEHPALDPLRWGLVGGHLDPGEDFATGACRELEEETEVSLAPEALVTVADEAVHGGRMRVHAAACNLTDADIVCHEGLQIVFVEPEAALGLDLGTAARDVVPAFLQSETYLRLRRGAP